MKTVQILEFGGPEQFQVREADETKPGPGEVLIRVRAVSLNYRDILVARGLYNPKLKLPMVPGSDGAGEVVELGLGVTRFTVGARVASAFMPAWISGKLTTLGSASALGGGGVGMLSEYLVLPETALVSIPQTLSYEEASTLPCAGVTAWHALVEAGRIKAGETVVVQGTGGVSIFALQIAKASGATVIATSSSDTKLQRVLEMGASHGINYKREPDWDRKVRELTGGEGADHIVEVGGSDTLSRSLKAVSLAGQISLIGVLSGGISELNIMPILMRAIRIQGIYVGSRTMLESLSRAIESGAFRPVIDRVFPMEEIASAVRHMESGEHFGKVVIQV